MYGTVWHLKHLEGWAGSHLAQSGSLQLTHLPRFRSSTAPPKDADVRLHFLQRPFAPHRVQPELKGWAVHFWQRPDRSL